MLREDIRVLDKVMNIRTRRELINNYFCWLYPFTNENISGYYELLELKDKKILTVTSSGDHAINALLNNCNSVDSFDINPLAKYYSELKCAAIKSLSYEEFILFFNSKLSNFKSSKFYFDKSIYKDKISKELNGEFREFWDYFFIKYSKRDIRKSFLFSDDKLSLCSIIKINDYLKEDGYYKVRDILKNKKINYFDIDISKLGDLDKEYDLVILSNVVAYLDEVFSSDFLKEFRTIVDKLNKSDRTRFVLCYLYSNCFDHIEEGYEDIYNYDYVNKYFDSNSFEYLDFLSTDEYEYPTCFRLVPRKDKIIVSRTK